MTPRVRTYARIAACGRGTSVEAVLGQSHYACDAAARKQVWRWLRADGFSFTQIGRWTGRHHSSVTKGLATRGWRA